MDDIHQIPFDFDPQTGMRVGAIAGFLVFALSPDLTREKPLNVLKRQKAFPHWYGGSIDNVGNCTFNIGNWSCTRLERQQDKITGKIQKERKPTA